MHHLQSFLVVKHFTVFVYKMFKITKMLPQQLYFKYNHGCLPLMLILRKCMHWLVPMITASINWFKRVTDCLFLKLSPMVIWTNFVARKPMADVIFLTTISKASLLCAEIVKSPFSFQQSSNKFYQICIF